MDARPGSRLGRFEVLRPLGSGGMGVVYLAHDTELDRPVALKLLPQIYAKDEDLKRRFLREARAASALNHPNILTVHDVGLDGRELFIATEYVDGVTLRQAITAAPSALPVVLDIAVQTASALSAAHAAGVIHRDVKPENLMLRSDGIVKVLDFGLAKVDRPSDHPMADTVPNALVGTVRYMSPEQVRSIPVDGRTDVWSLGVVLFEMLTRRPPFTGPTASDTIVSILTEALPPVLAPDGSALPADLVALVTDALKKGREDRIASSDEMLRRLRELRRTLGFSESGSFPAVKPSRATASDDTVRLRADLAESLGTPAAERRPLPRPAGPLVGREAELALLRKLLLGGEAHLVTLTGPGGTGKTRLALAAAAELADAFVDGAVFVPLDTVTEPALVATAIAEGVGLPDTGTPPLESLREHFRGRRQLMVLDNFEQVTLAAGMVSKLLRAAPGLRVLATSRECLGLEGERELPVPPLGFPTPENVTAEDIQSFPSVRLFVERARAASPVFAIDDENASAVAEICRNLDGLPLAIELAAARVRLLPPSAMRARLDSRLKLLTGGPSDRAPRQRTIKDTIDWGYQLLSEDEKRFFARVSVFVGSFSLEAAEAVCGTGDVVESLSSLLAKSFLRPEEPVGDEPRFGLLGMIREFGREALEARGELRDFERRHAAFFAHLAIRAETELRGDAQATWLRRLALDHENFRSALEVLETEAPEVALRTAGALFWFWYLHGHYREGGHHLATALERAPEAPASARAPAIVGAGALAFLQCDYERAHGLLAEGRTLAAACGDRRSLALALQFSGSVARERGRWDEARLLHTESESVFGEIGDLRGVARSKNYVAFAAWLQGELAEAEVESEKALQLFRSTRDDEGIAWALLNLTAVALYRGEADRARALLREASLLSSEAGFREGTAWSLNLLGLLAVREAHVERARVLLSRSLAVHRSLGDRWRTASVLEALASVVGPESGARLLGASSALRETIGTPVPPIERDDLERATAALKAELGADGFASLVAAARVAPLARVVGEALGLGSSSG